MGTPKGVSDFTFSSMVSALKSSLAEALSTYHTFVGKVITNPVSEPELLCNNRYVDFTIVYADVEPRELSIANPDDSVEGKLVLKKNSGVLSVPVTELKCCSLVVACTFDNRVADAYSANMF
ncbi:fatty alcohol:caffeoyl-CoA acyltransferase-like [Canna indica]|uniref:Fatty alcohol:caffeoyl-CoA acyltransferase-like n=1 Tax=Canna indica TaxID=4628 RepID=A0AAQ3KK87_9LILI|nr:fatty alcohol:caffeoyl-CoA acyltransferase-like [Canna indica]